MGLHILGNDSFTGVFAVKNSSSQACIGFEGSQMLFLFLWTTQNRPYRSCASEMLLE
ncbi:hypothetical protein TNIN_463301, partial [Trichonephila inaurata madagascariensis]